MNSLCLLKLQPLYFVATQDAEENKLLVERRVLNHINTLPDVATFLLSFNGVFNRHFQKISTQMEDRYFWKTKWKYQSKADVKCLKHLGAPSGKYLLLYVKQCEYLVP